MFMPSFCIKLIELGISIACLVLQQYSYDLTDVSTLILCSGTYMGFILVLTGELIGEMLSNKQDPFIEAWWSGAGAALYGACGARTLQGWRHVPDCPRRDRARATAICALAATSVLIVDAIRVLCAEDGSSIASSHKKLSKAKAPKLGLDLTSASNKSPICMTNWTPARLIPAKVAMNDLSAPNVGLNMDSRLTGGAPKITPQKLDLKKFPATCRPLSLGPKVNRSFW